MRASRFWDSFLVELRPGDTVVHIGDFEVDGLRLSDHRVGPLGQVLAYHARRPLNHVLAAQPVDVLAFSTEVFETALRGASIILKDPHVRPRKVFIELCGDQDPADTVDWLERRGYTITIEDEGILATIEVCP